MNGEVCCILAVCCPPGSRSQRDALAREMVKADVCDEMYATDIAAWFVKNFDLAEVGTLQPFVKSIKKQARHSQEKK